MNVEIQIGHLPDALARADAAIASTGTVTMECAFFGVPTVTLYKNRPGLLANRQTPRHREITDDAESTGGREVYPEFIQGCDARREIWPSAALELLQNLSRRQKIKWQLAKIISSLGQPGATKRAAEAGF